MSVQSPAAGATGEAAATPSHNFSRGYVRYAMWLLLGIYIINFLDRQVVNILAEPIKQDLGLSDTQLGLMSGLAFAVFYTVLGIPLARLAERKNRATIIGVSVAVWSGFTALCGQAQNFVQLILFRIGVGVGEAGCTPPAHSLITDYVPKEKRSSALAFYSMGTPLGSLLGLVLGGLIADAYGWRAAFLVAGAPGLIFALLAIFTLKEPRKLMAEQARKIQAAQATFGQTLKYLAAKRTFWLIAMAAAIKAFIGYGHAPFTASFFLRNHGDQIAQLAANMNLKSVGFLGLTIGLLSGVAGALGSFAGGWIADKFGVRDVRAHMVAPAIASLLGIPAYVTAMLVGDAVLAFGLLTISYLLGTMWYGPVYGTAQSVVPPHMRATAAAILLFVINLIGLGLGPLAVGALSDAIANAQLAPQGLSVEACKAGLKTGSEAVKAACGGASGEGVRWALIIAAAFGIFAFLGFWFARRTIREDSVS